MNLFEGMPGLMLIAFWVLILVAAILILVSGRRDDDAGGTRTQMRYVGTISIVTLFAALFAFFAVAQALTGFIVDGHSDNNIYRTALNSGLTMLAAGAVFVFHYRRAKALAPVGSLARGATGAAARAALYGVCFVAAVVAISAATKAVYGVFQIIAPGVFGGGAGPGGIPVPANLDQFFRGGGSSDVVRQQGIADVLSYAALLLGALLIFLRSWNWLPEHRS